MCPRVFLLVAVPSQLCPCGSVLMNVPPGSALVAMLRGYAFVAMLRGYAFVAVPSRLVPS